jgi:ornithine decarboxylase
MKANNFSQITQDLCNQNIGFSLGSQQEMQQILSLNLNVDDIIYSNPIKDILHINFAYKKGIKLIVADSFEEIDKIIEISADFRILLRISN